MKHLCYVYIKEYGCIKDVELIVDCHYNYLFDRESGIIDITDNQDYPNDFWSPNIYSISGIVGNNGAGKSSIMSYLLDFLVEGSAIQYSADGIFVYEENGEHYYYGDDVRVLYNNKCIRKINSSLGTKDSSLKMPSFYYSGHFLPHFNDNPRNSELNGCYIASDNVRLVMDLQNHYNEDSFHMNHQLVRHLYSHIAENNYRICMMLADAKLSHIVKKFVWPQYIIISINDSGKTAMNNGITNEQILNEKLNKSTIDIKIPEFKEKENIQSQKDRFILEMIYHNLLNITYDRWGGWRHGFDIIDKWQDYKSKGSIIEQFSSFINTIDESEKKSTLISLCNLISNICDLAECENDILGKSYMYIKPDKLEKLGEIVLKNDFYITSRFFDISYAQSLEFGTILSSGEQELLNFLSRLYDAIVLRPNKFSHIQRPYFLLLDEAEIGFHPDWQRRYMNLIITFLDALRFINNDIPQFQIVISSHSPILLSDIPKCCTNYIKRDINGFARNVKSEKDIKETFAANIFDLYRMSFFMNDGLIGEFAKNKITVLSERIDNGETIGIVNEIKMIGDNRIREFLMDKYREKHSDEKSLNDEIIKYYQDIIEQLKK